MALPSNKGKNRVSDPPDYADLAAAGTVPTRPNANDIGITRRSA
jgi:hypothetical protein